MPHLGHTLGKQAQMITSHIHPKCKVTLFPQETSSNFILTLFALRYVRLALYTPFYPKSSISPSCTVTETSKNIRHPLLPSLPFFPWFPASVWLELSCEVAGLTASQDHARTDFFSFPNSLHGRLLRLFCVWNHLGLQVTTGAPL